MGNIDTVQILIEKVVLPKQWQICCPSANLVIKMLYNNNIRGWYYWLTLMITKIAFSLSCKFATTSIWFIYHQPLFSIVNCTNL
jgi:hypothetical protein